MIDADEVAREVLGCDLTLADSGQYVCETEHGAEWDCADEEQRIARLIRVRDAEIAARAVRKTAHGLDHGRTYRASDIKALLYAAASRIEQKGYQ